MNSVTLMGRLTRDPEIRISQGAEPICVARFTLAVDRRGRNSSNANTNDQQSADFIPCVCFGRIGEFAEKYLRQGIKILLSGRIQTGSYTNKDGNKVYTTDIIVNDIEFAESKNSSNANNNNDSNRPIPSNANADGFMSIPEGIENDLPFK